MKLDERSALPDDVVFPILSPDVDEDDYYDVIKEKRNTLNRTLGRVGKKIGAPDISFYSARHTYATRSKRKGVPTSAIQDVLGHSTEQTTQAYLESFEDQVIDYKVYLTYVKSNLGKGMVPYMVCPASGRRCRILYRAFGSPIWKAKQAYSERLYYESQLWSKNQRVYGQWYLVEKRLRELSKGVRNQTTYNGKLTRRHKAKLNWERKSPNTGLIF